VTDVDTSEPVKSIRTPIAITYNWSAGVQAGQYLRGLLEGRLVGSRCPSCHQVYFPGRGVCPTCAVALTDAVELSDRGTITSFCIVNVPFLGQRIKIPYVAANIVVDGADIAFGHLVLGCEAHEVHMGMRVEAVWRPPDQWGPSLENIDHFRPSGQPDAPFDSFSRHL
jgi:uncharacterized OB-fold protein